MTRWNHRSDEVVAMSSNRQTEDDRKLSSSGPSCSNLNAISTSARQGENNKNNEQTAGINEF